MNNNYELPLSENLNIDALSRVFNSTTTSYKLYWLYGIINLVIEGKDDFSFSDVVVEMITLSWYSVSLYKLNLGKMDRISDSINEIINNGEVDEYSSEAKIRISVKNFIKNNDDRVNDITRYVPYRIARPFLSINEGSDYKDQIKLIENLKSYNSSPFIVNEKRVTVKKEWSSYIRKNYCIIEGWLQKNLIQFIQRRNPNTPSIILKLKRVKRSNLMSQRKLWESFQKEHVVIDLYTDIEIIGENVEDYGVMSIDHFVPFTYVMHDLLWNLVPSFKNINSKKGNRIITDNSIIEKFIHLQYDFFEFLIKKRVDENLISDYELLSEELNLKYFLQLEKNEREIMFKTLLKDTVIPLNALALRSGFERCDALLE